MSAEIVQIVHYAITGLLALATLYHKFVKDKDKKDRVCQQDFQQVKTDVEVLKERVQNTNHMLEQLDDKLDEIDRELRK